MKTKADVIKEINKRMCFKSTHSLKFNEEMTLLLKKFKQMVYETPLLELDKNWTYVISTTYCSIDLLLNHGSKTICSMIKLPVPVLTVEDYATLYDVEVVTVRQWIRRGKIRTAQKAGKEWRIPILTEAPQKGYIPAKYVWNEGLELEIENFPDFKNYKKVIVFKDELRFHKRKRIKLEVAEREKIELLLIANPNVKFEREYTECR